MTRPTRLEPKQTMQQLRAEQRRNEIANAVAGLIARQPGIGSRREIAEWLGYTIREVNSAIKLIKDPESQFTFVDFGRDTARGGPFAGETRFGWWPMKLAAHQSVMGQADRHASLTERGVRMARLIRKLAAEGIATQAAEAVVVEIEDRLGVDISLLSASDLDAFEDVLLNELTAAE